MKSFKQYLMEAIKQKEVKKFKIPSYDEMEEKLPLSTTMSDTLPGMDLTAELGQTPEQIDSMNDPTRGGQTGIFGKPGNTGSNQKPNTSSQTPFVIPSTPIDLYDKNKGRVPCSCCGGKGYTNNGNNVKRFLETCSCCGGSGFARDREPDRL